MICDLSVEDDSFMSKNLVGGSKYFKLQKKVKTNILGIDMSS